MLEENRRNSSTCSNMPYNEGDYETRKEEVIQSKVLTIQVVILRIALWFHEMESA
jgi:hypothetical protein